MIPSSTMTFDPATIVRDFPPVITSPNVCLVYEIADAAHTTSTAPLIYSRWTESPLPSALPATLSTTFQATPDFFTYDPAESQNPSSYTWHLNFAHFDLFHYYGSGLFAQDEMQVAEHPVLASLRRALLHHKLSTLTVEDGRPTPILVRGAERRIRIATEPNASQGRPNGLYGNRFSQASGDAIRLATTKLSPLTLSNIIAMEAPPGGSGEYTIHQIRFILTTAFTAFQAACIESHAANPGAQVHIHTGFWGCGAYGGNRPLMTLLQLLAAQLAQIDHLHFHTGDKEGLTVFKSAETTLKKLKTETLDLQSLLSRLAQDGYRWGMSDGN